MWLWAVPAALPGAAGSGAGEAVWRAREDNTGGAAEASGAGAEEGDQGYWWLRLSSRLVNAWLSGGNANLFLENKLAFNYFLYVILICDFQKWISSAVLQENP